MPSSMRGRGPLARCEGVGDAAQAAHIDHNRGEAPARDHYKLVGKKDVGDNVLLRILELGEGSERCLLVSTMP